MTNFIHWRTMTCSLGLWSGYIATWTVVTGSGPATVTLWWLAGMIVLGSLWLATQPLFRQGRGPNGFIVMVPPPSRAGRVPRIALIGRRSPPPTFPGDAGTTSRH